MTEKKMISQPFRINKTVREIYLSLSKKKKEKKKEKEKKSKWQD